MGNFSEFDASICYFVIGTIDKYFTIFEQTQFLAAFFFHASEVFLMRTSQTYHNTYCGLYNIAQSFHFSGL